MKTNSTGLNRGKTHKLHFVDSEVSSVLHSETLGLQNTLRWKNYSGSFSVSRTHIARHI